MTHEFRRSGEAERRCPICHQPALERWQPFCSQRCTDIDLGRWLSEQYRISVTDADEDEEADDAEPADDEAGLNHQEE